MISDILKELTKVISSKENVDDVLTHKWESISQYFASKLYDLGNTIISSIKPFLSKSFPNYSVTECLTKRNVDVSVAKYRLRPITKYYLDLNKDIPLPENPKGPHATGLALSLSLLMSFKSRKVVEPAKIIIEFQIEGDIERKAFGEMLNDYNRPIAKLIQKKGYKFFTAVPFNNVDAYKGKDVVRKLSLYYQNIHDNENYFTIYKELTANHEMSDAVKSVIPLAILYDCAMGYSQLRKNRDRMFQLMNIIENDAI